MRADLELSGNDENVDDIVARIRSEVAKRKLELRPSSSPTSAALDSRQNSDRFRSESLLPPEEVLQTRWTYHLADFCKLHDEEFIVNAYRGILRREPDDKGLGEFLTAYREGTLSKSEILGRLRFSKEGRAIGTRISGLVLRFALLTAYRIPVVGYLIAVLSSIARLPTILKESRKLEAFTVGRDRRQAEAFNSFARHMNDTLATKAEANAISELRTALERLDRSLAAKAGVNAITELRGALERLDHSLTTKAEVDAITELRGALERLDDSLATKADVNAISEIRSALERVEGSTLSEVRTEYESLRERLESKDETREVVELGRLLTNHKLNLLDQERRLGLILEELRKRLPAPITTTQIERVLPEEDHLMDAFYVSFEDRFRGTRDDIKRRISIYLPIVKESGGGTDAAPLLDLGCGRGELLELLREEGFTARGLDVNRRMVSQCRDLGLDAIETDAIDHLRSLSPNSLGAITGMHIIEHLPFARLIPLLDEALRVLKPGGVAIFETPNPENLVVGAYSFYCDPTHRNPIPPPTIQFVAEARGFVSTRIERLNSALLSNPFRGIAQKESTEEVRVIRHLLEQMCFSPPDYALIAYKA